MDNDLTCQLCGKTFRHQFAREFHFDVVHGFRAYMCRICDRSEDSEHRGSQYTYFEYLDHLIKYHNGNPYKILYYLNVCNIQMNR